MYEWKPKSNAPLRLMMATGFLGVLVVGWFVLNQSRSSTFEPLMIESSVEGVESSSFYEDESIYVDIKGAINEPNVYQLPAGSRLFDLLALAGGLKPEAASQVINQAQILTDQQLIYIPTQEELEVELEQNDWLDHPVESSDELININTADAVTLQQLPGIGVKKAEQIIAYRQQNGSFTTLEDLMSVSGIGQKTFEGLKDAIKIHD